MSSPRVRGYFHGKVLFYFALQAFPAYAGIFLADSCKQHIVVSSSLRLQGSVLMEVFFPKNAGLLPHVQGIPKTLTQAFLSD